MELKLLNSCIQTRVAKPIMVFSSFNKQAYVSNVYYYNTNDLEFPWFTIVFINFKTVMIVYKCLHGLAPSYWLSFVDQCPLFQAVDSYGLLPQASSMFQEHGLPLGAILQSPIQPQRIVYLLSCWRLSLKTQSACCVVHLTIEDVSLKQSLTAACSAFVVH